MKDGPVVVVHKSLPDKEDIGDQESTTASTEILGKLMISFKKHCYIHALINTDIIADVKLCIKV